MSMMIVTSIRPVFRQQGVAVILVLLIMVLATTLAVWMATQQSLWLRQVSSQFEHAQARYLAVAGVDWARAVLADDSVSGGVDHDQEMWAMQLPAMPVDNGEVEGVIQDQQGLYNLNNLVRYGVPVAAEVAQFRRLLGLLGLPDELALSLLDWMDADSELQYPGSAESGYYLTLPHPYRAANLPLIELGELERVKGFNREIVGRLAAFVTVLPGSALINVNFAAPEVLSAVLNVPLVDARQIVQQRRGHPFKSVDDFAQRVPRAGGQLAANGVVDVASHFFLVTGHAVVGNAQVTAHALLWRNGGWPKVVWQIEQ